MPLPLILGIGAAIAGATGVGLGIKGAVDLADAKDTLKRAQARDEKNIKRHEATNKATLTMMDALGKEEMSILASFKSFADLIQKIQNRPEFANIKIGGAVVPKIDYSELERASVGAAVLVGGLGGAAIGTAGGFAASSATTAAVMALGTASTGTAISSLSGAAATNATLAALGGGSLATGGGGMALGSAILGGATLGVGLLVGGIIFGIAGSNVSDKADEAWNTMKKNEEKINKACQYLDDLKTTATGYLEVMQKLNAIYKTLMLRATAISVRRRVNGVVDWNRFTPQEKLTYENLVLTVSVLYKMCKVQLVRKQGKDSHAVNHLAVDVATKDAKAVIAKCA